MEKNAYGIAISQEEHSAWNKLDKQTREYLINKYKLAEIDDNRLNRVKLAYEEALSIIKHGIQVQAQSTIVPRPDSSPSTPFTQESNPILSNNKSIRLSFCVALDSENGKNIVNLVDITVPYLDITEDEDCIVLSFMKDIKIKLPDFVLVKFKHDIFDGKEQVFLFKASFESSNKSFLVLTTINQD